MVDQISGSDKSRRMVALFRAVLALPAVLTLATAPLSAATPGLHLVPLCTADGPKLVPIGGPDPTLPPADHDRQGAATCAHALCPRELLPGRKARTGV